MNWNINRTHLNCKYYKNKLFFCILYKFSLNTRIREICPNCTEITEEWQYITKI